MIDTIAELRAYLLTVTGITDLTSTRIYGGRLPKSFTISQAIEISADPEDADMDENANATNNPAIIDQSFQFKCYGGSPRAARETYRALSDALLAISSTQTPAGVLMYDAVREVGGQDLIEPTGDTDGWPYTFTRWTVSFRNST